MFPSGFGFEVDEELQEEEDWQHTFKPHPEAVRQIERLLSLDRDRLIRNVGSLEFELRNGRVPDGHGMPFVREGVTDIMRICSYAWSETQLRLETNSIGGSEQQNNSQYLNYTRYLEQIITLLVDYGANINAISREIHLTDKYGNEVLLGYTPLQYAIKRQAYYLVPVLLHLGAAVNLTQKDPDARDFSYCKLYFDNGRVPHDEKVDGIAPNALYREAIRVELGDPLPGVEDARFKGMASPLRLLVLNSLAVVSHPEVTKATFRLMIDGGASDDIERDWNSGWGNTDRSLQALCMSRFNVLSVDVFQLNHTSFWESDCSPSSNFASEYMLTPYMSRISIGELTPRDLLQRFIDAGFQIDVPLGEHLPVALTFYGGNFDMLNELIHRRVNVNCMVKRRINQIPDERDQIVPLIFLWNYLSEDELAYGMFAVSLWDMPNMLEYRGDIDFAVTAPVSGNNAVHDWIESFSDGPERSLRVTMMRVLHKRRILSTFVKRGVNANAVNNDGNTPLTLVRKLLPPERMNVAMILMRQLVQHGASLDVRDGNNMSPLADLRPEDVQTLRADERGYKRGVIRQAVRTGLRDVSRHTPTQSHAY